MADETITLQQYVNAARQTFLTVALLPDQNHSLEITPEGCLFLLTWTKCFTEAFSKGKSWNGDFTLADFKVCRGHVQKHKKPKKFGDEGMKNDMEKFVEEIELVFRSRDSRLRFTYPPYFSDFTFRLRNLEIIQNTNNEEEKFPDDSGIELMIPYHLGDFIARIVAKVILDGIDITDEYDLNLAS
uniref:Uncharacterized protein n=2 Tax=Oryza TaxID=4527 RepID=A0A0D3HW94_9ORYZ